MIKNEITKQKQSKSNKIFLITSKSKNTTNTTHKSTTIDYISSLKSSIQQIYNQTSQHGQTKYHTDHYHKIQCIYNSIVKYIHNIHVQVKNKIATNKQTNKQQNQKFIANAQQCALLAIQLLSNMRQQLLILFHQNIIRIFSSVYEIIKQLTTNKKQQLSLEKPWFFSLVKNIQMMDKILTNNIGYNGFDQEIMQKQQIYLWKIAIYCGKLCTIGLSYINNLFENLDDNRPKISEIHDLEIEKISEIGSHTLDILVNNHSTIKSPHQNNNQLLLELTTQLLQNKIYLLLAYYTNIKSHQLARGEPTYQQFLESNPSIHKQIQQLSSSYIQHIQSQIFCNKMLMLLSMIQPIKSVLQTIIDKIWKSIAQVYRLKNKNQYEVITIIMCKYSYIYDDHEEKKHQLASKWLNLFCHALTNNDATSQKTNINITTSNCKTMTQVIITTFQNYNNAQISNTILSYLFSPVNHSQSSQTVYTSIYINPYIKQILKLVFQRLKQTNSQNWQQAHPCTNTFVLLLLLLFRKINQQISYTYAHYLALLKLLHQQIIERVHFSSYCNISEHIQQTLIKNMWVLILVHTGDQLHNISKYGDETVANLYSHACNYLIDLLECRNNSRQQLPNWLLSEMLVTLIALMVDLCSIHELKLTNYDQIQQQCTSSTTQQKLIDNMNTLQILKEKINKITFDKFIHVHQQKYNVVQPVLNKCVHKILNNLIYKKQHFENFVDGTIIIEIIMQQIVNCITDIQQNLNTETVNLMQINPFYKSFQQCRTLLTPQQLYLQLQRVNSSITIKQLNRMLFALSFTTQLTKILLQTKNNQINGNSMQKCIKQYRSLVDRYIQNNFHKYEFHQHNNGYLFLFIHILTQICTPIINQTDETEMQQQNVLQDEKINSNQFLKITQQLIIYLDKSLNKFIPHHQHKDHECQEEIIDDNDKYNLLGNQGDDDLIWKVMINTVDKEVGEAITILCAYCLLCKIWNYTVELSQMNGKYIAKLFQIHNKIQQYLIDINSNKIDIDTTKNYKSQNINEYLFLSIKSPLIHNINQIITHLFINFQFQQKQPVLTAYNLLSEISSALNTKVHNHIQKGVNYYQSILKLKFTKKFHSCIIDKVQQYCTKKSISILKLMEREIDKNNEEILEVVTINNRSRIIKNMSKLGNLA